jgi:prolyl-tRNA synthetase
VIRHRTASGVLAIERGIEVGHVFYPRHQVLGSHELHLSSTRTGKPRTMFEMGCYGIGVTRHRRRRHRTEP